MANEGNLFPYIRGLNRTGAFERTRPVETCATATVYPSAKGRVGQ